MADSFDYAKPTTPDIRATPPTAIGERIRRGFTATVSVDGDGLHVAAEPISVANLAGGVAVVTVPIVVVLSLLWREPGERGSAGWLGVAVVAFALFEIALAFASVHLYRASRAQPAWLAYLRCDHEVALPSTGVRFDLRDIASLEYVETSVDDHVDGELRLVLAIDDARVAVVRDDAKAMRTLLPIVAGELRVPLVEFIIGSLPWNAGGIWRTPVGGRRARVVDDASA